MMTAREYTEAFFRESPNAKGIRKALEAAEQGDARSAFLAANPIGMQMNAADRHALSDAIYALLAHQEANR